MAGRTCAASPRWATSPYYLISTNPAVKSIADFGPKDRIALPAVTVSVQARILQMASAKQWGARPVQETRSNTQALPHPDAAAAIIAGGTEINAHFGNPPFQEQELAGNPKAKIVLDSYQVLGGPASATVLYATEKYREGESEDLPRLPRRAGRSGATGQQPIRKRGRRLPARDKGSIDRALLLKVIKDPEVQFKVAPQNTLGLAQFLHRGRRDQEASRKAGRITSSTHPALASGS